MHAWATNASMRETCDVSHLPRTRTRGLCTKLPISGNYRLCPLSECKQERSTIGWGGGKITRCLFSLWCILIEMRRKNWFGDGARQMERDSDETSLQNIKQKFPFFELHNFELMDG